MGTDIEAISAYVAAVSDPSEESAARLEPFLADDIEVVGMVAPGRPKSGVLAALGAPKASRLLTGASWGEPELSGDAATIVATLPPASPLGGLSIELRFTGAGKIASVGQSMIPRPAPEFSPIAITAEMQSVIDGALANGTPIILGYVDAAGAPHLSPRGTVQVYDPEHLGTWARDPQSGFVRAIERNPNVALLYRDPANRTSYTFGGRAALVTAPDVRERIFAASPELERNLDGRMLGVAIMIELDSVDVSSPSGRIAMRRSQAG